MKKKILILNGWFLPGFKGGGPVQSCNNIIQKLHNNFDFYFICGDRDLKDKKPYDNIKINDWNNKYNANIYYISPEKQNFNGMKTVLNLVDYDVVYLNNFFNFKFTIIPLILKKMKTIKNSKFILSVRGDFTGGLENKKIKKYAFICISKILGLYNNIIWHATSNIEKKDILKIFPKANIIVIPNLSEMYVEKDIKQKKDKGILKLIYISRIFPKKNIIYALNILKNIKKGNVIYDIYGSMEDEKYWNECKKIIEKLPSNIKVNYCGELPHEKIGETFQKYHSFFFPTLGENFGHVIVESMMNNCPCILSEGVTPWDNYIKNVGYGATLDNKEKFINDINKLLDLNQAEFIKLVKLNNDFIKKAMNDDEILEKYNRMFMN